MRITTCLFGACLALCATSPADAVSTRFVFSEIVRPDTPVPGRPGETFATGFLVARALGNDGAILFERRLSADTTELYSVQNDIITPLIQTGDALPTGDAAGTIQLTNLSQDRAVFASTSTEFHGIFSVPVGGGTVSTVLDGQTPIAQGGTAPLQSAYRLESRDTGPLLIGFFGNGLSESGLYEIGSSGPTILIEAGDASAPVAGTGSVASLREIAAEGASYSLIYDDALPGGTVRRLVANFGTGVQPILSEGDAAPDGLTGTVIGLSQIGDVEDSKAVFEIQTDTGFGIVLFDALTGAFDVLAVRNEDQPGPVGVVRAMSSPLLTEGDIAFWGLQNAPNGLDQAIYLLPDGEDELRSVIATRRMLFGGRVDGVASEFDIGGDGSVLFKVELSDGSQRIVLAELAPIPLPAGLPLLAAGLGTLVLLRRRRP